MWRDYFYFDNNQSQVKGNRYFLSSSKSLKDELSFALSLLNGNKINESGKYIHCLFPARYMMLKEKFNISSDESLCQDYLAFKKGLDIDNVFFVFTSAYANNPASIFGHTFLRFGRKSRGNFETTKEILGYSMAFQARPKKNDGALVYTYKGLTGGYMAYPDIKPHYINIGIYNNGESRDLWEFKLNLSRKEKEFLSAHLWELSHAGAFRYYFFDDNCSSFILKFLQNIRSSVNLNGHENFVVIPQETFKEVYHEFNATKIFFRPSLRKKIEISYRKLSEIQKNEFKKINDGKNSRDKKALDVSIAFWKFKNYSSHNQLASSEKERMFEIMMMRSSLGQADGKEVEFDVPEKENPIFSHAQNYSSIGLSSKDILFNYRFGLHRFSDSFVGHDRKSFISLLDIYHFQNQNLYQSEINLLEILSLQELSPVFNNLSWRVRVNHQKNNSDEKNEIIAGVGTSLKGARWQMFAIPSLAVINNKRALSAISAGLRYDFDQYLRASYETQVYATFKYPEYEISLAHFKNGNEYKIKFENDLSDRQLLSINYGLFW